MTMAMMAIMMRMMMMMLMMMMMMMMMTIRVGSLCEPRCGNLIYVSWLRQTPLARMFAIKRIVSCQSPVQQCKTEARVTESGTTPSASIRFNHCSVNQGYKPHSLMHLARSVE